MQRKNVVGGGHGRGSLGVMVAGSRGVLVCGVVWCLGDVTCAFRYCTI